MPQTSRWTRRFLRLEIYITGWGWMKESEHETRELLDAHLAYMRRVRVVELARIRVIEETRHEHTISTEEV